MAPAHRSLIGTSRAGVRERPCRRQRRSSTGSGWYVRHPPFTRCGQGGRMRPLRGNFSRFLLGPLLVGSALLGACAPAAAPAAPSTAPAPAPTAASPAEGVSVLVDAALPRLPLNRFLPGVTGWPDRLADGQAVGDATADPAPEVDHGIALGGVG